MGGTWSGRSRTRNRGSVEAALRLDLRVMRRQGLIRPGRVAHGIQRWSRAGVETGSANVTVNLADPEAGFVLVRFNLNGEPRSQTIPLASQEMRFGGRRYYFICPKQGRRCEVLPMAGGVFASRQSQRLTYQSQCEDQVDRLRRRATKLENRLLPEKGKPRPRGPNRARLLEDWLEAQTAFESTMSATIMRRWGHLL